MVEAKEREESCIGASTLNEIHSTEATIKHRIEMNGWLVGHDMEMLMTKEEVWTRKDK